MLSASFKFSNINILLSIITVHYLISLCNLSRVILKATLFLFTLVVMLFKIYFFAHLFFRQAQESDDLKNKIHQLFYNTMAKHVKYFFELPLDFNKPIEKLKAFRNLVQEEEKEKEMEVEVSFLMCETLCECNLRNILYFSK